MSKITVETVWMEHSGGTKFYQIFQIAPEGGKSLTICHWGKMAITHGSEFVRPIVGGENQLHEGRFLTSKENGKVKRGYHSQNRKSQVFSKDSAEAHDWFVGTFGATLAWEIENRMFGATVAPAVAHLGTKPTPAPKAAPETTSIEPSEPLPESWGTW